MYFQGYNCNFITPMDVFVLLVLYVNVLCKIMGNIKDGLEEEEDE